MHKPISLSKIDRSIKELLELRDRQYLVSMLRSQARRLTKKIKKECALCGYTHHVEVCHIKPISEFGIEARMSEINHPDNLILLCPNHHWELDHSVGDAGEIRTLIFNYQLRLKA